MTYRAIVLTLFFTFAAWPKAALSMEQSPLFHHVQAEISAADWGTADEVIVWDGFAWYGGDEIRLWIKSEGERDAHGLEESEVQALLGVPIARFWDLQAGIRQDFHPRSDTHAVLSLTGLAPYFFEVDTSLFVSQRGVVSVRAEAEIDLLITQRLILTPHLEIEGFLNDAPRQNAEAGFAYAETGLQLRYEIDRKFAPFVALHHERDLGNTRDLTRRAGGRDADTQIRVGIRAWLN